MYLRKINRKKDGKDHVYWALMESYRTERGPRQRTVAYLGELDESGRLGVKLAAEGDCNHQCDLFTSASPRWVSVDLNGIRVERVREFGGVWLGLELLNRLGLSDYFKAALPQGREGVSWSSMAMILILCRFCNPSSELYIAEHFYQRSGLSDLLGVSESKIYDNRLYRALDRLLPFKDDLEGYLKGRLGRLFNLRYDLLLYDITSTYFEGEAKRNPLAQRGYSRDKRSDCKQVCIGLVVSKEGIPLGYEVFAGNTSDSTTLEAMVLKLEDRYGVADRIWVLDRGMISSKNMEFLSSRKYIVGTPKSMLKNFEQELVSQDWERIQHGVEVKRCSGGNQEEVFILCRSSDRRSKEQAIHDRFKNRVIEGLQQIQVSCKNGRLQDKSIAERRVGRLLGRNSRAARFFKVDIEASADGKLSLRWRMDEDKMSWSSLTEGHYLLRSNVRDWSAEDLWKAYIQLSQAEAAFRIQKSDLKIRPVWHQKEERVLAHILVCFLSYVLWKTLAELCKNSGLGTEPRKVLDEISRIQLTDVVLPTRDSKEIRLRCVSNPDMHQRILLQRLGLKIPSRLTRKW